MGSKVVLVGALAGTYFFITSLKRTTQQQIKNIKKTFSTPTEYHFSFPLLLRKEEKTIKQYLEYPPIGPLVLIGPDGTGKSTLLKSIFHERAMSVFIDLRQLPVTTDNEFIYNLIVSTGYNVPSMDFFTRWLLREKSPEKKPRIDKVEIDKAFVAIGEMLKREKAAGWTNGIPVICINHCHFNMGITSDFGEIDKFFNFCLWLSDNRLAHLIITTNRYFSEKVLDANPGWLSRRELIFFGSIPDGEVASYLGGLNEYLEKTYEFKLTGEDIRTIVGSVGGSMADICRLLFLIAQGNSTGGTVAKMIADSVSFLILKFEDILNLQVEDSDKYKKYLRLWALLEKFASEGVLPRNTIIEEIFEDNISELDFFESSHILSYSYNTAIDVEKGISKDFVTVSPWSKRMQVAIQVLVRDHYMLNQKNQIEKKLKKEKLKSQKKEIQERMNGLIAKKTAAVQLLQVYLEHKDNTELRDIHPTASLQQILEEETKLEIEYKRLCDLLEE
eukprot:TRINITY_DN15148_c0_g1_i1.p1 TRINITY_DN15148_c0_g1~~TRINITY_DN15148_c0_g1_i1.p1  ORF type:complete len:533 (+),score=123.52 TRINITY_DN15148_c0_g1_i1:96-1601(+)